MWMYPGEGGTKGVPGRRLYKEACVGKPGMSQAAGGGPEGGALVQLPGGLAGL